MRNALIVGINYYENIKKLYGCVNDARKVEAMLSTHGKGIGGDNFSCLTRYAEDSDHKIKRSTLKDDLAKLFSQKSEVVLFYFSGHGHIDKLGGYLLTPECERGDAGISLNDILNVAHDSPALNKIIILDCCHSGIAAASPTDRNLSILSDGMTVLTASTEEQYAIEKNGTGVFTNLLVGALNGAAANVTGAITPGSIYAYIDQSLAWWEQRPVFKTNVERFISLRNIEPKIPIEELKQISEFFPEEGFDYKLDPSYEPRNEGRTAEMPPADPVKNAIFAILQKYNRNGLLVPYGADHMWNAAMESKSCKLTALGEHYRNLAEKGRIKGNG